MRKKKNSSYIGKLVFGAVVVGIIFFMTMMYMAGKKEKFVLSLSDESGNVQDKTESEQSGYAQAESGSDIARLDLNHTNIGVLLYSSDYQSMYHESLSLQSENGVIILSPEILAEDFAHVQEQCRNGGYYLEQQENCYCLKREDDGSTDRSASEDNSENGGNIEQCSIARTMGYPVYRGCFYLYPEEEGLVIVNELPFEEYLYGVLPSEMPASFEAEALKAQAVCARTFACRYLEHEKYPGYHAALDDSTSCQVYLNLPEQEETNRAVDETNGILLTYNGTLATTFYYSTSCGLSADVTTWPDYAKEEYPYLTAASLNESHTAVDFSNDPAGEQLLAYLEQTHSDYEEALPWYRWSCTVEQADTELLYERMTQRYRVKPETIQKYRNGVLVEEAPEKLSMVTELTIEARNAGGSATALRVTGPECTYLIYGEYNIRYLLCTNETRVTRQDGSVQTMTTILPSGFFVLQPILYKEGNIGYSIVGGGYGHGVGLSQNGANEMAKRGMDFRQILAYFYTGTELMRLEE